MNPPSPRYADLPLGSMLPAGMGYAEVVADLDCETFSEAGFVWDGEATDKNGRPTPKWRALPNTTDKGLFAVGAAVYTEHPSFEVLTLSYNLKDGRGIRRWKPGQPAPQDLFDYLARGGLVESHNCGFEFWVWWNYLHRRLGWPMIPHDQQRCSMAKARAHGLPGGLAPLGSVLGAQVQKDKDGKALLDMFSVPRNPTKADPRTRIRPADDPVAAERLYRYCDTDIATEAEVSALVPDLSPGELQWWKIDQLINRRGVQIDVPTVEAAINVIEQAFARYNAELCALTGGAVQRASELEKLKAWLKTQGVYAHSMDADALEELMKERARFPAAAARAIEIRALIGSASVKKCYAMRNQATQAGRLHELFGYHAARTGRTNGMGPQPTNLPNSGPDVARCQCGRHYGTHRYSCPWCGALAAGSKEIEWCAEAAADAIACIQTGALATVEHYFGDAVNIVSACLRGMFIAAPGYDLVSSDYTAIEAVVLAQLAGEQWRIDLFKGGGKIYEASGAKIQGITYEEAIAYKARTGNHHPCRKVGKVAELAGGYQGWIGAYKQFGADEFMTDQEIKQAILAWRLASPMIVRMWGGQFVDANGMPAPSFFRNVTPRLTGLEGMAIAAVMYPGQIFDYRGIKYFVYGDVLYCELLSGRRIAYHRPRLRDDGAGGQNLSFEGWNTNPKNGPIGWIRMDTYGGKLTENVVQATARDILVHAIVNLWKAGYAVVMHVYDEIIAEVLRGHGSVEELESIMGQMPAYAEGWPVAAHGGWRGQRYRK